MSPSPLQRFPALARRALVAIAAVFTLARFSEAFLVLKVTDVGVGATLVPLVRRVLGEETVMDDPADGGAAGAEDGRLRLARALLAA